MDLELQRSKVHQWDWSQDGREVYLTPISLINIYIKIMEIVRTGDLEWIKFERTEDVVVAQVFIKIYSVGEWYPLNPECSLIFVARPSPCSGVVPCGPSYSG